MIFSEDRYVNSLIRDILGESLQPNAGKYGYLKRPMRKINEAVYQKANGEFIQQSSNKKGPEGGTLILSNPPVALLKKQNFKCSDINHFSSYLFGQLCYDLGIYDQVHRSNNVKIKKSNKKLLETFRTVIGRFLGTFKDPETPNEMVRDALDNSRDNLEKEFGIKLDILFKDCPDMQTLANKTYLEQKISAVVAGTYGANKTALRKRDVQSTMQWIDSVSGKNDNYTPGERRSAMNTISNTLGMGDYDPEETKMQEYEPGQKEIDLVHNAVNKIYPYFRSAAASGIKLVNFRERFMQADSVNTMLRQSQEFEPVQGLIYETDYSVGQLRKEIEGLIENLLKTSGAQTGNLLTLLQSKILDLMTTIKTETGEKNITPSVFFKFQLQNSPDIANKLQLYGLEKSDLTSKFKSWKELMDYFYNDENINKLADRFGYNHKEGANYSEQNNDLRALKKREEALVARLEKAIDDESAGKKTSGADKLKAAEEAHRAAIALRDELAEQSKNNPELKAKFEEAKKAVAKAGRHVSTVKFQLKKASAKGGAAKTNISKTTKQQIEADLEEVRAKIARLTQQALENHDEGNVSSDKLKRDLAKRSSEMDKMAENYMEASFTLYTSNTEAAEKIARGIEKMIKHKIEGGESYVNVSAQKESNYHKIVVDYPSDSNFNKMLEHDDEKFYLIIDHILKQYGAKFGKRIGYDPDSLEYGESMSGNVDAEYWYGEDDE